MSIETSFTDRHGGVSKAPFDTFNLAFHTGDDPNAVRKNRSRLRESIGIETIVWMDQVHGDHIEVVTSFRPEPVASCDAVVTDRKGLALAVMVADCIPILMYDPDREVIAALHAGRKGTLLNIASKTVETMVERFDAGPDRIRAMLGPSIHVCCYEVGPDIAAEIRKNHGSRYVNDRSLDLQELNRDQLVEAGVQPRNIEVSPICTCCDRNYFSYRREGVTGRFAGIIWMR